MSIKDYAVIKLDNSEVLGDYCTIDANNCIVRGDHCGVYGNKCTVRGNYCIVYGDDCSIYGKHCEVYGKNPIIHGSNTRKIKKHSKFVNSKNDTKIPIEDEKDAPEDEKCKICVENKAIIVFVPCGHNRTCKECSDKIVECPFCKQKIESKIKIFR